ncbi:MAG: DUF1566 domain-containing protein [bacterium]|nr:DUF1566 domain-containing protein [bacterium]
MKALHWTAVVVLTVLVSIGSGATSTPQLLKIQGFLSDQTGGSPVPANGAFSMTFTLFDDALTGVPLATDSQSVTVTDGIYEVALAFDASAFDGPTSVRYVEIQVEGELLSPRTQVVSTPYAYTAEKLAGQDATDLDQSAEVTAVQTQLDTHETGGDPHTQYVEKAGDTMSGPLFVSGNIGIGTTSPLDVLHVRESDASAPATGANTVAVFERNGNAEVSIIGGSTSQAIGINFGDSEDENAGRVWYDNSADTLSLRAGGSGTAVTVQADGKVGIGTNNPATPFQVSFGTDAGVSSGGFATIGATSSAHIAIDNNEIIARNNTSGSPLHFNFDNGGNIILGGSSGGKVGIGTANPGQKLTVAGTIQSTSGGIKFPDGTMQLTVADPGAVQHTGQTQCWDQSGVLVSCAGTGQDGEYQNGTSVSPRFTDNGNGTVTDNLTGLIWTKKMDCDGAEIWWGALSIANSMADPSCGLTDGSVPGDWRLPNIKELRSMIDFIQTGSNSLPVGHPFTNIPLVASFWSSTTSRFPAHWAMYLSLGRGDVYFGSKQSNHFYTWAVRDPL